MKALVLEEYKNLVYKDIPEPVISDDDVLVQVKACGICGSDVHGYDGSSGRRVPPVVMGHEASGVIVEKGSKVTNWNKGDRVTFDSTIYPLNDWYTLNGMYNLSDNREVLGVSPGNYNRQGAFAEYVAIPRHVLYKIPDNVPFEHAAMVEPIAVAMHAVNIANPKIGDSCAVVGIGMIGSFILQLLHISGIQNLIAIDINEKLLNESAKLGASLSYQPDDQKMKDHIIANTKKRGVDISFEAVGISETVNTAIDILRKGGKTVLVGNVSPSVEFPLQKVVTQEIKVLGSCAIRGEYEAVLDLLSNDKINPDNQISVIAPLCEGAEWFSRLYDNKEGLKKVVLKP